ncbi:MAG: hypothetical protein N2049_02760 [Anaerolineales bacterium]|nr:hypothetical protein [Anaerolineales bacterium]MCX7608125.1 hypothetical protein [Anaerolineales bacterium]MDW8226284.1 hypothetical protein [Anaerolineales bacterium]
MLAFIKKPIVAGGLGFVIGLFIGLVILGWWLWPVEWKDADPSYLNTTYAADYLRMTIESYEKNGDRELALARYRSLGAQGPTAMNAVMNQPGYLNPLAIANFQLLLDSAGEGATPSPEEPAAPGTGMLVVIIGGGILAVLLVAFLAFRFVIPLFRGYAGGEISAARRAQQLSNQTPMTDYEAMGQEPPIAQFITTYVSGDDYYDESFSIELPTGEFLGECGIGISDTIGVGEPKKVTAFELWLFDKSDIQTVTKVIMSNHAYNDPAIRQRLEAKGEPILAQPGKQIILETKALQLVAIITDIEYASGDALPAKSHFDRLTVELAVWPKVA